MRREFLQPGVHGPSLRWYEPKGLAYLAVRSCWRFWITGRPLWGRGDNATFLHDATVDHRGGPVEKLTRARWHRLAWRWTVLAALLAPAVLWLLAGRWVALSVVVLGAGAGGWRGYRAIALWWPQRAVRSEFVYPVWAVACRVLGERYSKRVALRSVMLPPGFGLETDDDQPELTARVHLPLVPLDEGVKKRLAISLGERLGMPDPAAAWVVRGPRAYVDLSLRQHPPRALTYAEVRKAVLEASPAKPFVGLAAGRRPVFVDLDNDGPHIGVSAGSGAGKSTLMRLILSARMAAGIGVVCCDYKVISHEYLRRIAREDPHRAIYATDEEEISDVILAVFAEFTRRREILKTEGREALEGFREIDLVIEELNSLASLLRKWWGHERRRQMTEAKEEGLSTPYVPVVPPAVDAMGVLVQAGRELRIHVHLIGQRLDASAISPKDGGAIRETLSNRLLAKYTRQAWKMLCDGVPFEAFPGGPRGIWTAVQDNVVTHFRVPFMTEEEAYSLAMSGEAPGPILGSARLIQTKDQARLVTIGEAWELVGAPSLAALQKAVQRAKLTPAGRRGNALQYDYRELERLS